MNRLTGARHARLWFALGASLGALALPTDALGLEEGASTVGGAAGAALLQGGGATGFGPSFELSGGHALTDVWAAHVSLSVQALHFEAEAPALPRWQTAVAGFAGARVAYDVLRVIPFATVGIGGAGVTGGGSRGGAWAGAEAQLGAEYLLDRHWSLAPAARVRVFPLRLSGAGDASSLVGVDVSLWLGRRL